MSSQSKTLAHFPSTIPPRRLPPFRGCPQFDLRVNVSPLESRDAKQEKPAHNTSYEPGSRNHRLRSRHCGDFSCSFFGARLLFSRGTRRFLWPGVSFSHRGLRASLGFRCALGTCGRLPVFGTRGGWSSVRSRLVLSCLVFGGATCSGFIRVRLLLVCASCSCLLLSRLVFLCSSRTRLTFSCLIVGGAICSSFVLCCSVLIRTSCSCLVYSCLVFFGASWRRLIRAGLVRGCRALSCHHTCTGRIAVVYTMIQGLDDACLFEKLMLTVAASKHSN